MGHEISEVAVAEVAQLAEGHAAAPTNEVGLRASRTVGVGDLIMYAQIASEPGKPMRVLGMKAEGWIAREDRSVAVSPYGWRIGA